MHYIFGMIDISNNSLLNGIIQLHWYQIPYFIKQIKSTETSVSQCVTPFLLKLNLKMIKQ